MLVMKLCYQSCNTKHHLHGLKNPTHKMWDKDQAGKHHTDIWKQFWMKNKRLWQVNPHQKHGTICGSNIYPKTGTGRQAPPTCKPWSDSVEMNWQSTSLPDNILLMQYEKNWWIATRLQNYIANLKICNPSFPTNLSWQVSTKAFSFWS